MFRNIGQKFMSSVPLEQIDDVTQEAPQTVQENILLPEIKNPLQLQNTSARAEMQLSGISMQTILNKNLEMNLSLPQLSLQKDESGALEAIREKLKAVPTEVFTGSGDDQVDINKGPDNLVHVKVNGAEVWSGTELQFQRLKIDTGAGDDKVINTVDAANIFTGSGNDKVESTASNASIDTGDGNDRVKSTGSDNHIETGRGADNVQSRGESNQISTGSGNDYVKSQGDLNSIDLGDGFNSALSSGDENVLEGGRGHDFFNIFGDDNSVSTKESTDKVWGAGDRNVVDVGEGTDDTTEMVGNDNEIVDPD
jgi:hypothetical protein